MDWQGLSAKENDEENAMERLEQKNCKPNSRLATNHIRPNGYEDDFEHLNLPPSFRS